MTTTMVDDFAAAVALVLSASSPEEVFGPRSDAPEAVRTRRRSYRRLARLLHPDAAPDRDRALAAEAFAKLTVLWDALSGTSSAAAFTSPTRSYALGGPLGRDDVANLYSCTYDLGGRSVPAVLKLPRDPADSDLLAREERALSLLAAGEARLRPYVPHLVEAFDHVDVASGASRRALVLARTKGLYSLAQVMEAYPGGLDPRDAAWMWRRLLVAVGFAHRVGLVHGAVLPQNVLVLPSDHGLVLSSWSYSALLADGEHVPAMVSSHTDWYPPEVSGRLPASPATDVFLVSRTVAALMGARAPAPMRAFLAGCTLPSPRSRPADAWALLAELDELLVALWGPRRFRPFEMPSGTRSTT